VFGRAPPAGGGVKKTPRAAAPLGGFLQVVDHGTLSAVGERLDKSSSGAPPLRTALQCRIISL